jgi:hypothetical protein
MLDDHRRDEDRQSGEKTPDADPCLRVVDDFGHPVPVSAREVEVIETYLASLLDEVLGGKSAAGRTSSRHKKLASASDKQRLTR